MSYPEHPVRYYSSVANPLLSSKSSLPFAIRLLSPAPPQPTPTHTLHPLIYPARLNLHVLYSLFLSSLFLPPMPLFTPSSSSLPVTPHTRLMAARTRLSFPAPRLTCLRRAPRHTDTLNYCQNAVQSVWIREKETIYFTVSDIFFSCLSVTSSCTPTMFQP